MDNDGLVRRFNAASQEVEDEQPKPKRLGELPLDPTASWMAEESDTDAKRRQQALGAWLVALVIVLATVVALWLR